MHPSHEECAGMCCAKGDCRLWCTALGSRGTLVDKIVCCPFDVLEELHEEDEEAEVSRVVCRI